MPLGCGKHNLKREPYSFVFLKRRGTVFPGQKKALAVSSGNSLRIISFKDAS